MRQGPSNSLLLQYIVVAGGSVLAFYRRQEVLKQCLEFLKHCSEGYYWATAVACKFGTETEDGANCKVRSSTLCIFNHILWAWSRKGRGHKFTSLPFRPPFTRATKSPAIGLPATENTWQAMGLSHGPLSALSLRTTEYCRRSTLGGSEDNEDWR